MFSVNTAETRAQDIKNGLTDSVIIELKSGQGRIPSSDTPNAKAQVIIGADAYIFLYEMNSTPWVHHHVADVRKLHVVPKNAIGSIRMTADEGAE